MITLIQQVWHAFVLRHGDAWNEINFSEASRKHGVIITCDCGKRWLSRAPWDVAASRSL